MSMAKVAISIDNEQLKRIDYYVKKKIFKNRSQAFQLSINQTKVKIILNVHGLKSARFVHSQFCDLEKNRKCNSRRA